MRTFYLPSTRRIVALTAWLLSCQLAVHAQNLTNGGFDVIAPACANDVTSRTNPFADGCISGWNSSHGTPSIDGTSSDYYAFMYGGIYPSYGNVQASEGIFTSYQFQSGKQYTFTFFARNIGTQTGSPTLSINVATGLQERGNQNISSLEAAPTTGITKQQVGSQVVTGSWAQYQVVFTPTFNATQFWLYTASTVSVSTYPSMPHDIEVNGLTLAASCDINDIYYQNTSSVPGLTQTQGSIFAGSSPNPSLPSGPVTISNGQSVRFLALKTIGLTSEFSVEPGATFSAIAVRCPGSNRTDYPADSANNAPLPRPCDCLNNFVDGSSLVQEHTGAMQRTGSEVTKVPDAQLASTTTLEVYPRPARDYLLITLPGPAVVVNGSLVMSTVDDSNEQAGIIYDSHGYNVQQLTLHTGVNKVALTSLNPGIYYLYIKGMEHTAKVRFSVEH